MSNYKELVEKLRRPNFAQKDRDEAANAIEQLCAEVARLEAENRAKEQYISETIGKVIKERDAAIADLKSIAPCQKCKHFGINRMTCDALVQCLCGGEAMAWEWRGVQEVEDGNS